MLTGAILLLFLTAWALVAFVAACPLLRMLTLAIDSSADPAWEPAEGTHRRA